MEHAVGAAGGAAAIILVLIGAIVWVVKRVIPAMILQNRSLVDGALENMKANTKAIHANTEATTEVANSMKEFMTSQAIRDQFLFKQLDRMEGKQK